MVRFILEKTNELLLQPRPIAANYIGRGDGCSVVIGYSNWNNFATQKQFSVIFYAQPE